MIVYMIGYDVFVMVYFLSLWCDKIVYDLVLVNECY